MPEAVVASDGRVAFTGLTTRWAEDNRLDIAGDLERLGPEGSGAIAEALREAGPTVTIERLDVPLIVHAWLGRQWCVWALAESAARVTPAGQIGAVIARIIGLGPGPERSADGETLVFTDEELAAWCADQDADRWRIRVGANGEGGQSSTFEAVCHPWRGWYVGFERKGADGSTFSLSLRRARAASGAYCSLNSRVLCRSACNTRAYARRFDGGAVVLVRVLPALTAYAVLARR